jgi:hypothetical protein
MWGFSFSSEIRKEVPASSFYFRAEFFRSRRKIPIRCNKAQMGIILRNCKRKKIQPLATNLAKAVTVHPKLFHVEQFGVALEF